jgi:hypothetical protein
MKHEMTDNDMLDILTGEKCFCGKKKKAMMSHCRSCYYALPPEMRRALYRRFFEGYQAAFLGSLDYLAEAVDAKKAVAK